MKRDNVQVIEIFYLKKVLIYLYTCFATTGYFRSGNVCLEREGGSAYTRGNLYLQQILTWPWNKQWLCFKIICNKCLRLRSFKENNPICLASCFGETTTYWSYIHALISAHAMHIWFIIDSKSFCPCNQILLPYILFFSQDLF